jgi:cytochrome P450
MVADSLSMACSETSAASLGALWYFLAKYPKHAERISQEVIAVDTDDDDVLASLPHLNGVINESMRLLPAALTFGARLTPAKGCFFGGTFIPGNTNITAPRYTIGRSEFRRHGPGPSL